MKVVCTFFGHKDAPQSISVQLENVIIDLIENRSVDEFYVGNHGNFDKIVYHALKKLRKVYPNIRYSIVIAYLSDSLSEYETTVFPEGIENVPFRYAISYRNKWMEKHADIIIAFVTHSYGGAAKFVSLAEKQGKEIIYIK